MVLYAVGIVCSIVDTGNCGIVCSIVDTGNCGIVCSIVDTGNCGIVCSIVDTGNCGIVCSIVDTGNCGIVCSIVDTGNCEAPFRAGCQPLFVLTGCLFLNYSSLLREGHSPTPALQPFFALTGLLHFFCWIAAPYLNIITPCSNDVLLIFS